MLEGSCGAGKGRKHVGLHGVREDDYREKGETRWKMEDEMEWKGCEAWTDSICDVYVMFHASISKLKLDDQSSHVGRSQGR